MKMKKKNSVQEQVKAARKQSREEEIKTHGKLINYRKVMESKRKYNRKKNKADDEVLPFLFTFVT
jgi:Skp family chaperone for outer membrane proteins